MREIRSHTNEYIKELRSLNYKKHRDELGKYIVEGTKIITEAIDHGAQVESVLTAAPHDSIVMLAEQKNIEVISVSYDIIQQVADTKSPPKELAVLRKNMPMAVSEGRFFVAMDDVNDPKNLGSIIRTADAAGADGVLVSDNSADIYGPKVQRAAMGSTFHVPVEVCNLEHKLRAFKHAGGVVVSGHLSGKESLEGSFERVCLVIGNEARGVSPEIQALSDVLYRIKIYGQAESLNASVAAGIMMYDIRGKLA